MKRDLKKQIYQAQCTGNVEPIEYMVPYPSMRSLIEGQNIKFAEQLIFEKPRITNLKFYELIQQTSHWLDSLGLKPKKRIILTELDFPQTEILLFGIWHLGAIAVIPANESLSSVKKYCDTNLVIEPEINLFDSIENFPTSFEPKYKPLLDNEALVTFEKGAGIRLSHYNLLVNTNSIQKVIKLKSRTRFSCSLKPISSAWAVLKAILPIYCGCIIDNKNPEFTIGESDSDSDFIIRKDLKNLKDFRNNELAICPENSAVLTKGKTPLHLTDLAIYQGLLKIQGHSIMMGYLNDALNKKSFYDKAFHLQL